MVPEGSIYFWMYEQGLKHVPLAAVEWAVRLAGKDIRRKDAENYWRGWQNSDLRSTTHDIFAVNIKAPTAYEEYISREWRDYPPHPYAGYPDIVQRWVPCNQDNKPMIKWVQDGCLSKIDASCFPHSVYLGENLKGCQFIVIDCDGDHELPLDLRTIAFLQEFGRDTQVLSKPKAIKEYEGYEDTGIDEPASFHLVFRVDRLVKTVHCPWCHIDILGNAGNQLHYLKNKSWNGLEPQWMTPQKWEFLKSYIRKRRMQSDNAL